MKFQIKEYITPEGENPNFDLNDLVELEEFVNANIQGRKYGTGVLKFSWGFNLFEYKGMFDKFVDKAAPQWQEKGKTMISHSHFDWKKFAKLSKVNAVKLIKKECLIAIERVQKLKGRPRTFNVPLFYSEVGQVLDHHIKHNL